MEKISGMGKKFILSIDLGTTGNRVFCFSEEGKAISSAYSEFRQIFPEQGWVEHDAEEIWGSVAKLIPEAIANGSLDSRDLVSIGLTNQRETSLLWHRETGKPVYNAIVWQCRRTADICNDLKSKGYEYLVKEKTGLVIDAYFSGTKIKWILDNVKQARELAESGKLAFGTIDTWILWKLTSGKSHKTDFTNASRTMIFDIREKRWSPDLLNMLGIPESLLPGVQSSASDFGKTLNAPGIPDGVMIGGMAGDQQSAMVGQACVHPGTSKNTYGTGCFMLMNTGEQFRLSKNGLLATIACGNKGEPLYALEGSVFIGGAVVQWLRDYMQFFTSSVESESMASNANDGVIVVPAFTGLGAPYWKMDTGGAIFGLRRDTSRGDIIRASLKSIAFQSMDVIHAMEDDSGKKIESLRVDGKATENSFLMQFQSDILNIPVLVPEITESTALGAAYLAGITKGIYKSVDEISASNIIKKRYIPDMEDTNRNLQKKLWNDSVKRLLI